MLNALSFIVCIALLIAGAMYGWFLWACLIVWFYGFIVTEVTFREGVESVWMGLAIKACWPILFVFVIFATLAGLCTGRLRIKRKAKK